MTAYVIVLALVVAALAWFFFGGREEQAPRERRAEDIDHAELEAAERDVQEAADEESVRDWGPGAGRPPVA